MRDLFVKDWVWKLFSVLLAAAIWFTVHRILGEAAAPVTAGDLSTLTFTYRNLPVAIVSAGGDVHEYRLQQPTVSVTVSGPAEIIGMLQANQLRATVDLTDTNTVKTEKQRVEVSVPPGITVISIKPRTVGILPPR